MPQLEQGGLDPPRSIVDLKQVEQGERALTWDIAVRSAFPGLSVKLADPTFPLGSIHHLKMGEGEFFEVESAPADVCHQPAKGNGKPCTICTLSFTAGNGASVCVIRSGVMMG